MLKRTLCLDVDLIDMPMINGGDDPYADPDIPNGNPDEDEMTFGLGDARALLGKAWIAYLFRMASFYR